MLDPIEEGFLAKLRSRPGDQDTRLVYADWLEEHARPAESRFLRLQSALRSMAPEHPRFEEAGQALRELAKELDPHWRTIVARAPIEGCDVRFDFDCPKQWETLAPTALGDDIRFCGACKSNVYYSATVEEAYAHARQGRCVVVDLVQLRKPGDLERARAPRMAGAIAPPPDWHPPPDTERS